MTTTTLDPRLCDQLNAFAFAGYIRYLRRAMHLRQKDVRDALRDAPYNLKCHVKDLYEWEYGIRRPTSTPRAALIRVLGGSADQADELLLYSVLTLSQQETVMASLADAVRTGDQTAINTALEAARGQGEKVAESWIRDSEVRRLAQAAMEVAPEQREEALQLLALLTERSTEAAAEWLRYGRFQVVVDQLSSR
jgi:hypothetical protein